MLCSLSAAALIFVLCCLLFIGTSFRRLARSSWKIT